MRRPKGCRGRHGTLLGGKLVNPPSPVQAIWTRPQKNGRPPTGHCSGMEPTRSIGRAQRMSTMEQVEENVASAETSGVNTLTRSAQALALFDQVRAKYNELSPIPCTKCEYCLPCPNGVAIPRVFTAYNEGMMYDKPDVMRRWYKQWIPAENQAGACIQCLECEEKCPQNIPISEWMPVVQEVLGEDKPYVRQLNTKG